jgi:hypothetical protein
MYDGVIAHLTREYCGNVPHDHVVEVTSGSFEKETHGADPYSGAYDNDPRNAAKNAADLETDSCFSSACRDSEIEWIPHTRNNWLCYDSKERRTLPTHYAILTHGGPPGSAHLKSWLVEASADGKEWWEVARGEQRAAQRQEICWHISGPGWWRVPLHPAGERRQESHP